MSDIVVTLNVVGLYYGEKFTVPENPTVAQVLEAAEEKERDSGKLKSKIIDSGPRKGSITWISNDLTAVPNPTSRKTGPNGKKPLTPRLLRLEETTFNQRVDAELANDTKVRLAWQYYIEKSRTVDPKVTTTYSIDDTIVRSDVSNDATSGKKIENGDTVTLRLIAINTSEDADPSEPKTVNA